ncbi:MAG: DUF1501 domain-containing protein, partial [Thermoanaerobaculia bacterium]
GLVLSWFLKPSAMALASTSALVTTRGTAKNCIFIWLPGAPSQIDTFDLKEGSWTPTDFAPTNFGSGLRFPQGLLPKTADHLGELAIVRSCLSWALVHGLAQTWTQISRNPSGATGAIAPHLGAVTALELAPHRTAADVLPSFVALNSGTSIAGSGYLPSIYSPFSVQPTANGLPSLTHPDGSARFGLRYTDLQALDATLRGAEPLGKSGADLAGFYTQAKTLMDSPDVNALFAYTPDESTRYGGTAFGNSCLVAKKLLAGRRGARFIQVTLNGWDNHANIYAKTGAGLYTQALQLDAALANLLTDLKASPGETAGKTLLDETIVLVAGEFGRTVGSLNGQGGRDHFLRTSVVFAGGGVKGGQVIGSTDATGAHLASSGWAENRDVRPEDLAATLYSALGIDYTTVRHDDPLNRGFEYVPYAKDGVYKPIEAVFG